MADPKKQEIRFEDWEVPVITPEGPQWPAPIPQGVPVSPEEAFLAGQSAGFQGQLAELLMAVGGASMAGVPGFMAGLGSDVMGAGPAGRRADWAAGGLPYQSMGGAAPWQMGKDFPGSRLEELREPVTPEERSEAKRAGAERGLTYLAGMLMGRRGWTQPSEELTSRQTDILAGTYLDPILEQAPAISAAGGLFGIPRFALHGAQPSAKEAAKIYDDLAKANPSMPREGLLELMHSELKRRNIQVSEPSQRTGTGREAKLKETREGKRPKWTPKKVKAYKGWIGQYVQSEDIIKETKESLDKLERIIQAEGKFASPSNLRKQIELKNKLDERLEYKQYIQHHMGKMARELGYVDPSKIKIGTPAVSRAIRDSLKLHRNIRNEVENIYPGMDPVIAEGLSNLIQEKGPSKMGEILEDFGRIYREKIIDNTVRGAEEGGLDTRTMQNASQREALDTLMNPDTGWVEAGARLEGPRVAREEQAELPWWADPLRVPEGTPHQALRWPEGRSVPTETQGSMEYPFQQGSTWREGYRERTKAQRAEAQGTEVIVTDSQRIQELRKKSMEGSLQEADANELIRLRGRMAGTPEALTEEGKTVESLFDALKRDKKRQAKIHLDEGSAIGPRTYSKEEIKTLKDTQKVYEEVAARRYKTEQIRHHVDQGTDPEAIQRSETRSAQNRAIKQLQSMNKSLDDLEKGPIQGKRVRHRAGHDRNLNWIKNWVRKGNQKEALRANKLIGESIDPAMKGPSRSSIRGAFGDYRNPGQYNSADTVFVRVAEPMPDRAEKNTFDTVLEELNKAIFARAKIITTPRKNRLQGKGPGKGSPWPNTIEDEKVARHLRGMGYKEGKNGVWTYRKSGKASAKSKKRLKRIEGKRYKVGSYHFGFKDRQGRNIHFTKEPFDTAEELQKYKKLIEKHYPKLRDIGETTAGGRRYDTDAVRRYIRQQMNLGEPSLKELQSRALSRGRAKPKKEAAKAKKKTQGSHIKITVAGQPVRLHTGKLHGIDQQNEFRRLVNEHYPGVKEFQEPDPLHTVHWLREYIKSSAEVYKSPTLDELADMARKKFPVDDQ